jgi:hypothetical protein
MGLVRRKTSRAQQMRPDFIATKDDQFERDRRGKAAGLTWEAWDQVDRAVESEAGVPGMDACLRRP